MTEPMFDESIFRLKDHVRLSGPGGCRVLSQGDRCTCLRCDTDRLAAEIARLTAERDAALKLLAEKTDECVKLVLAKAEAEAIFEAAVAWMDSDYEDSNAACLVLEGLLSARREKGGAK